MDKFKSWWIFTSLKILHFKYIFLAPILFSFNPDDILFEEIE